MSENCQERVDSQAKRGHVVKLVYQSYLPYQGRYPRISDQAKILRDAGYKVTILACDRQCRHPKKEEIDGIAVRRLWVRTAENMGPLFQWLPLLIFFCKCFNWLHSKQIDILICHNLDVLPLGWLVRRAKGCKLIFDAHEPSYYALWPDPFKFMVLLIGHLDVILARKCDGVSVTNAYQKVKYQKRGVKTVTIIGNFARPELRTNKFSEKRFHDGAIVFGRFGTFYQKVGLEETLAAFRSLLNAGIRVRLIIGGRVVDNYRTSFLNSIKEIGSAVQYVGPYDYRDVPKLYKRIHVAVLTYPRSDWFRHITPTKFYDAVSNGVPVIMTDIGGLGEYVKKKRCGMVVDENDISGIAGAMERLARDRVLLASMSRNAFNAGITDFDWFQMRKKYVEFVERITEES